MPFPSVEVLSVKQFHGLLAGRQLWDLFFAPIGGESLRNRKRGGKQDQTKASEHGEVPL
jgi:hypothetical protein